MDYDKVASLLKKAKSIEEFNTILNDFCIVYSGEAKVELEKRGVAVFTKEQSAPHSIDINSLTKMVIDKPLATQKIENK